MKLAVLSDIHGNWPALEAVAADIDAWQPDLVVVNGDVVNDSSGASGGPSNGVRRYGGNPPGPVWVLSDAPLAGGTPPDTTPPAPPANLRVQ